MDLQIRVMYPIDGPSPNALEMLGGMGRSTLYAKIAAGKIKAVKDGRRTFITHAEIERHVASLGASDAEVH